ncbi:MAG: preprotein translocase subunit SecG [Legionellales bacterium]|nr:preprotein translocase subunit SecG [Legionellales bacterium]
MEQLILIIHVLVSIFLIVLILIQHGKGADMGAAFGSGASQTVFGSQGKAPFLLKLTGSLAVVFFVTCLILGNIASNQSRQQTILSIPSTTPAKTVPIEPSTNNNAKPISSALPVKTPVTE